MPHLGHVLVGAGLGLATRADVKRPLLRAAWVSSLTLLACLPDVLEWAGLLIERPLPRDGGAAAIVLAPIGLAVVAGLWLLGERSWRLALAALAALASHSLMDGLDGGIPLWWPWSRERVGPADGLGWDGLSLAERTGREVLLFGPVLLFGAGVAAWRAFRAAAIVQNSPPGCRRGAQPERPSRAPDTPSRGHAAQRPGLMAAARLNVRSVEARSRPGGFSRRSPPSWSVALAAVLPLLPLAGLVFGQLYGNWRIEQAHALQRAKRYAEAIALYHDCRRFGAMTLDTESRYWAALCHMALGEDDEAYYTFQGVLRHDPQSWLMRYGLAYLYVNAESPPFQRPAEALALLETLLDETPAGPRRETAVTQLQRGQAAMQHARTPR